MGQLLGRSSGMQPHLGGPIGHAQVVTDVPQMQRRLDAEFRLARHQSSGFFCQSVSFTKTDPNEDGLEMNQMPYLPKCLSFTHLAGTAWDLERRVSCATGSPRLCGPSFALSPSRRSLTDARCSGDATSYVADSGMVQGHRGTAQLSGPIEQRSRILGPWFPFALASAPILLALQFAFKYKGILSSVPIPGCLARIITPDQPSQARSARPPAPSTFRSCATPHSSTVAPTYRS